MLLILSLATLFSSGRTKTPFIIAALVSDYDCWKPHTSGDKMILLQEIIANMQIACNNCVAL